MGILFLDLGEVRTFELTGAQTIGRDSHNDIVVVHPTVSRHHARIEVENGQYLLTDFNSRNGTRVNGKAVETSELLVDGARMRIGHVRAWFFTQMPAKLPRSITNRDRGIVFNCDCGQRLWSSSDTAGMAVNCGGCNKTVEVPNTTQTVDDSAGTIAGVQMTEVDENKGPVCSVCQWPIERQERKHKCPACGLDFHMDCWRENRGCSSYGCSQVNSLTPKVRPAMPTLTTANLSDPLPNDPMSPHPEDTAIMPAIQPKPGLAWAHMLLALAVVSSLIGTLTFGGPPALVAVAALGRLLFARTDSKAVLFAAMLIALLGTVAGLMISRFWWLGHPLFEMPDFSHILSK